MDYCNGKATVIVINDNYKLAPWADILYACDPKWWNWHAEMEFEGRRITQDAGAAEKYGIEHIESKPEKGLSTDPSYINQGSNGGFQAINLAFHEGAERIILLGYDMKFTGGRSHWFGDHPEHSPANYGSFIQAYNDIPPQLPGLGLTIINCTRSTDLHCFPQKELRDCL